MFRSLKPRSIQPLSVLLMLALGACAPATNPVPAQQLVVASSPQGVAWAVGQTVFILQAPRFALEKVQLPASISGLAWWKEGLYASLPGTGWVTRVQGVADVRPLGVVVALSNNLVYKSNGEILTPSGQPTGYRLPGLPDRVLSNGDTDYALASGKLWILQKGETRLVRATGDRHLYAVPGGVQSGHTPTVQVNDKNYILQDQNILLKGLDGSLLKTVALNSKGECNWGVVYDQVMLVCKDGDFQRFDLELNPLGGSR